MLHQKLKSKYAIFSQNTVGNHPFRAKTAHWKKLAARIELGTFGWYPPILPLSYRDIDKSSLKFSKFVLHFEHSRPLGRYFPILFQIYSKKKAVVNYPICNHGNISSTYTKIFTNHFHCKFLSLNSIYTQSHVCPFLVIMESIIYRNCENKLPSMARTVQCTINYYWCSDFSRDFLLYLPTWCRLR